ncbi:Uma2 family endonuclease [Sporosarcina thermotolerans]|uniref:Uma2 family endonuclease n=1 Tax=Sporosarcina thermotolerans TaxID=633404 RepID=A0AAW9AGG9_9BACL|nr:Uma2 family endonuclease [Sporosarcina thermotolerans]MDW0118753.1 Uma2 family endonuclease [Sporosarcina thermotolerans]WHT48429.1 Uma2 family endonuclease [Sporosarcina thermotolerans]
MVLPKGKKTYSYADYLEWDNDFNSEALNGEIISMSPSPTPKHQDIVGELTAEFKMFLRGKKCMAFLAPMDVCLFADKNTKADAILDWVQPDLLIVCDPHKIGDKNIYGAPDLIVEVLSPSTARNDRLIKYNSYEKAGVKEYWIVDPYNMTVEIYSLQGASFVQAGILAKDDLLTAGIFPELEIDLKNIFKE